MSILNKWADRLTKAKVDPVFRAQPEKLAGYLPYEGFLEKNKNLILLSDGSIGCAFRISKIAHEAMTLDEMESRLNALRKIFVTDTKGDIFFQIIYDSLPSNEVEKPSWFHSPSTVEQLMVCDRILEIENTNSSEQTVGLPLKEINLYLMLRFSAHREDKNKSFSLGDNPTDYKDRVNGLVSEAEIFMAQVRDLLEQQKFAPVLCQEEEFLRLTKSMLHDSGSHLGNSFFVRDNDVRRLSSSLVDDFVTLKQDGISTGKEIWQVLSFGKLPSSIYTGAMSKILLMQEPVRVVLNIKCSEVSAELTKKEFFLRNARDAGSERQQEDVTETLESLAREEKLLDVSVHILVRHKGNAAENSFEGTRRHFENILNIPLISEKHAAPLVFWSCLPFGFNRVMAEFMQREKSILSHRLTSLIPCFSGFEGTGLKHKTQVLQNRAGEPIYLSLRASDTASHCALLGSSGAGKSFFMANLLTTERAAHSESLTFIIDNKTSYEILATTFGQEKGFQIVRPPATFPNLFKGHLDDEGERLRSIVNVLKAAITLTSSDVSVDAIKSNILGLAIRKTFEDANLDAKTSFNSTSKNLTEKIFSHQSVPRLSEVVDNFVSVCETNGFDHEHARWLKDRLSPFYGKGNYASLFDKEEFVTFDNPTPSVSLYDLDGVSSDKTLATLTSLIIISDVVRQIKRKENRGKGGQLIIEEVGVLGNGSKELVSFVEDSWKTFRKLGFMCIGLTNQVSDYKYKPGAHTIWAVSPNKIILKMSLSEIDDAFKETKDAPALLKGELEKSLISSLVKKDGVYAQGFFTSQETSGTFHYQPTGFDYWLAASKPEEVEMVHSLAGEFGSGKQGYTWAINALSKCFPRGVRDQSTNQLRAINEDEWKRLLSFRVEERYA